LLAAAAAAAAVAIIMSSPSCVDQSLHEARFLVVLEPTMDL